MSIIHTYKYKLIFSSILQLFMTFLSILSPFLLNLVINNLQKSKNEDYNLQYGIIYIIGYIFTSFAFRIIEQQAMFYQELVGQEASNTIKTLIYNKSLKISTTAISKFTQGEIINYIQIDSAKICEMAYFVPGMIKAPIQLWWCLYFLFLYFGYYLIISFISIYILAKFNYYISHSFSKIIAESMESKDKRVKMINEAISSIKTIKLNSWMKLFTDRINTQREIELTNSAKLSLLNSMQLFVNLIISPLILISTFGMFLFFGNSMPLESGFAWIQAFQLMNHPITWLPYFIGSLTDFNLSMKRIQTFLLHKEIDQSAVVFDSDLRESTNIDILIENIHSEQDINLFDSFDNHLNDTKWEEIKEKNAQKERLEKDDGENSTSTGDKIEKNPKRLDLHVFKGEFVCIIGEVGAGKSSLLNLILNEANDAWDDSSFDYSNNRDISNELLNQIKSSKSSSLNKVKSISEKNSLNNLINSNPKSRITLGGSVSYIQQTPWIQNKSVKDNILFDLDYDKDKYNRIIKITELESDLLSFPNGDLTIVGEKGINISGGQKARISLARAAYSDKDIILMDDPLSSIDSNMKKSIFQQVFLDELKGKTRVIVTHSIEFLDQFDRIIVMKEGKIIDTCSFNELINHESYKHLYESNLVNKQTLMNNSPYFDSEDENSTDYSSNLSDSQTKIYKTNDDDEGIYCGWDSYYDFFCSRGTIYFYIILIPLLIAYSHFKINYTYKIGMWIKQSNNENWMYSLWMVVLQPICYTLIICIVSLVVNWSTFRISRILHKNMLSQVLCAPINSYFDKTPTGRILNRFIKDINIIDNWINL